MAGTATQILIDGTPTNGANRWIDSLVWGGAWADTPGLPTSGGPVTISYTATQGADPYNVLPGATMPWSAAGLAGLEIALKAWEAVAAIDFVASAADAADVWLWQGTAAATSFDLGRSEVPGYASGEPLYVVFNGENQAWLPRSLAAGGYGQAIVLHEIGHLLGLAHPHDGGTASDATRFPGVSQPFRDYGDFNLNQGIFTTLTYNDGWPAAFPNHSDLAFGWQASPMALDIAAIQKIYGANTTYASGNTIYTLPAANAAGAYWSCIWDTGGTDLITNAGSSLNCTINLTPAPLTGANAGGYVSAATGIIGGFTIANGVLIENATGGRGNDQLTGNAGANVLTGGLGNDTMLGAAGNDTYVVDALGDRVFETTTTTGSTNAGGLDLVQSAVSFSLDAYTGVRFVENLVLTGTAALNGTGNALANALTGNAGANVLTGGLGNDTMLGAAGNDTYVVDALGDRVFETTTTTGSTNAGGLDLVQSAVSFSLDAYAGVRFVENLVLTGTAALNGTGNALANALTGNAGANVLSGGLGNDTVAGGLGADRLSGGGGADRFVFRAVTDSTAAARDVITDFLRGQDRIDLSALDANLRVAGDQAFGFIGAAAFAPLTAAAAATTAIGQIRQTISTVSNSSLIEIDLNRDGITDMQIQLTGTAALSAGDFIL